MQSEQFSLSDLETALGKLSMLRYWPADAVTRAEIGALLARIVPHKVALEWLVDELVNQVGEYPGPAELRGILCTHFRPADGKERDCSLPGYRPSDYEQRSYDEHLALKEGGVPMDEGSRLLMQRIQKRITA